jgi:SAM-dependent methyltransferase
VSVDANPTDVEYARKLNAHIADLTYDVQDALHLSYEDERFDAVTCLEVIEHVSDSRRLLAELARVVKPGGNIVLTCPSARFPVTYDPINWALAAVHKHLSFGAFGYGHSWLVRERDLADWASSADLEIVSSVRLTKALASSFECYWPGLAQRLLKANAANQSAEQRHVVTIRPSSGEPPFVGLSDLLIDLDARLFRASKRSVGLGYRLRKPARAGPA